MIEAGRRAQKGNLTPKQAFLYSVLLDGPKSPIKYSQEQLDFLGIGDDDLVVDFDIIGLAYERLGFELFPFNEETEFVKCQYCGEKIWKTENPVCASCKRKRMAVIIGVIIALLYFGGCIRF